MLESKFKTKLINEIGNKLKKDYYIFHLDPNELQGAPDLLILYEGKWAALEGKQDSGSSKRPNQEYYVNDMNRLSYASFISKDNKEEVLNGLYEAFGV